MGVALFPSLRSLIYPPMPPPPPGQEYVLTPGMKMTLHHYVHLQLYPPPPLTGVD